MVMKFTNNATSTLASGITSSATSLTVASGQGTLFPTLGAGDYFYCTLANVAGTVEIIKVTARSTDTFTVTRGQDNTTAVAWNSGDKVELRLVAASLNDIPKLDEVNVFTQNMSANSFTPGWTAITTAAGTTTLTSASTYYQRFTGSTTQTVVLPAATTMSKGQGFIIDNDSSGSLTLQDGSTASLGSVVSGMAAFVFCEDNSTTAGSWSGYMFVPGAGPGGQVTWGTAGLNMGGQTLSSVVLSNPTVTNYTETLYSIGNSSTAVTISLANGTYQTVTMTGNCTFTMPSVGAGKSFILEVNSGAGSFTGTFTSVKWPSNTAPTLTTTASRWDFLAFFSDNTNWYGNYVQAFQ